MEGKAQGFYAVFFVIFSFCKYSCERDFCTAFLSKVLGCPFLERFLLAYLMMVLMV